VIKIWEDVRIENKLTDAQREMLKTLDPKHYQFVKVWEVVKAKKWIDIWSKREFRDQEHHLFINERGEHDLVAIDEIPGVADGFFKAYSFRRKSPPSFRISDFGFPAIPQSAICNPQSATSLAAMRPFGTLLPVRAERGKAVVPVGGRTYLALAGMRVDQARQFLRQAEVSPARLMGKLVPAATFERITLPRVIPR